MFLFVVLNPHRTCIALASSRTAVAGVRIGLYWIEWRPVCNEGLLTGSSGEGLTKASSDVLPAKLQRELFGTVCETSFMPNWCSFFNTSKASDWLAAVVQ